EDGAVDPCVHRIRREGNVVPQDLPGADVHRIVVVRGVAEHVVGHDLIIVRDEVHLVVAGAVQGTLVDVTAATVPPWVTGEDAAHRDRSARDGVRDESLETCGSGPCGRQRLVRPDGLSRTDGDRRRDLVVVDAPSRDGVSVRRDRDLVVTGRIRRRLEHPGKVRCLDSDRCPADRPARHGIRDETADPSIRAGGAGEGRGEDERGDSERTNGDPTRGPTVVGGRGGHGEHAPGKGPRHRCVGSESLKVSGEIIGREAQVGDPSSAESKDPRQAFGGSGRTIWTIGHSTRSLEEFVALLGEHRLQFLADVRHFPTSQRVPWTARASLSKALSDRGIAYEHFEDLGGFRKARPDSVNTGWRNVGFRGYADYMGSTEFSVALDRLITFAADRRTAIMCAEAVPWKCHRSLLSDALVVRGVRVIHILSAGKTQAHGL